MTYISDKVCTGTFIIISNVKFHTMKFFQFDEVMIFCNWSSSFCNQIHNFREFVQAFLLFNLSSIQTILIRIILWCRQCHFLWCRQCSKFCLLPLNSFYLFAWFSWSVYQILHDLLHQIYSRLSLKFFDCLIFFSHSQQSKHFIPSFEKSNHG